MTWQDALDFVKTLATGSHSDWRLPNVNELESLIHAGFYNPALPQGHPFTNVQSFGYWSSTSDAYSTNYACLVGMGGGNVYRDLKASLSYYVWPVRAGQCGSFGDLFISKSSSGSGTVTSEDGKIDCGNDCTEKYPLGTEVTLTAAATAGSTFTGWSGGGCSGTGQCVMTITDNVTVTANFDSDITNTTTQPTTTTSIISSTTTIPGTTPSGLTYTEAGGSITITGYNCTDGALEIPDTIDGKPVVAIAENAFKDCTGLTSVTIPASITTIGNSAFNGCIGLNTVCFDGNAPAMGAAVFDGCANDFIIRYSAGATGFAKSWYGYPTAVIKKCPAQNALGYGNPKLDNLRDFRDSTLAQNAIGRKMIQIYYNNSGSINATLDRSPALRAAARRVLEVVAQWWGVRNRVQ